MLSDGAIQEILSQAMEKQFSIARPATRHFFEHEAPTDQQPNTVTIHQWVCATVRESDTRNVIVHLANMVVKEVVSAAAKVTGEVIFGVPNLLPRQPIWTDGSPLFATHKGENGDDRFGLIGGNLLTSSSCLSDDVATASRRLSEMDPKFKGDERLQLFCAKPMEKALIRACAKAKVPCRVFGVYNHNDYRSWVITRDRSACSLLIGKSRLDIPVEGNKIVVAARLVVWINNPRLAVHMRAAT